MTASVEAAYLEHHIVEEVTTTDREVTDIAVRLEAEPFFSDLAEGEADVWRWHPRTVPGGARPTFVSEGISEFVMELQAA